uniref:Uncharacterized protein n=1 Tax=Aegilops tauschii subsp. strangulata TaxID=200361 RepID=A0A453AWK2_AEGTS
MAAKVLQLRSSDGKVLVAPAWDCRPAAAQALPLEMRVPSRNPREGAPVLDQAQPGQGHR